MTTIKRLAQSHMARFYGVALVALALLITGDTTGNTALMGIGALVAFVAGAEFSGEVICDRCRTSLDSEELPDGTEPDSGEHGFRLHRPTADERWADEWNGEDLSHGLYPDDRSKH